MSAAPSSRLILSTEGRDLSILPSLSLFEEITRQLVSSNGEWPFTPMVCLDREVPYVSRRRRATFGEFFFEMSPESIQTKLDELKKEIQRQWEELQYEGGHVDVAIECPRCKLYEMNGILHYSVAYKYRTRRPLTADEQIREAAKIREEREKAKRSRYAPYKSGYMERDAMQAHGYTMNDYCSPRDTYGAKPVHIHRAPILLDIRSPDTKEEDKEKESTPDPTITKLPSYKLSEAAERAFGCRSVHHMDAPSFSESMGFHSPAMNKIIRDMMIAGRSEFTLAHHPLFPSKEKPPIVEKMD